MLYIDCTEFQVVSDALVALINDNINNIPVFVLISSTCHAIAISMASRRSNINAGNGSYRTGRCLNLSLKTCMHLLSYLHIQRAN